MSDIQAPPPPRFERLAILPDIQAVFERIRNGEASMEVDGHRVSLKGLRLHTFATSPCRCSNPECAHVPSYFAVERHLRSQHPEFSVFHLNLYGTDEQGNEILFTHDHTLARGLGGADSRENTTLMCNPCNFRKARLECKLVHRKREEEEKRDNPEGYALRKKLEEARQIKRDQKRLDNLLQAAAHFLDLPQDKVVEHANKEGGGTLVANRTAYALAGLTPQGNRWLEQATMAFFKAQKTQRMGG